MADEMTPAEYAQYLADREAVQKLPREVLEEAVKAVRGLPSKSGDLKSK